MGDGPGDERGARVSELRRAVVSFVFRTCGTCLFKFHFLLFLGTIGKPVVHTSSFYFSIPL